MHPDDVCFCVVRFYVALRTIHIAARPGMRPPEVAVRCTYEIVRLQIDEIGRVQRSYAREPSPRSLNPLHSRLLLEFLTDSMRVCGVEAPKRAVMTRYGFGECDTLRL
jgi:hypothetical protein